MDHERWTFPDLAETEFHPLSASQSEFSADLTILPSRQRLLSRLQNALRRPSGPLLITGEPGSGKTWLWRRLEKITPRPFHWACVDLTPALSVREFFLRLTHALGLGDAASFGDPRLILADFLLDQAQDDRRWILAIEEGQNLNQDLLEEARVLTNRLGQEDGFASLLLIGQTRLARELKTRQFLPFDDRMAARAHLRPIDADEAAALLSAHWPELDWPLERVERLHADSAGNPRRLLGLALKNPRYIPEKQPTDLNRADPSEPKRGISPLRELSPNPSSPLIESASSSAPARQALDIDQLCAWPSIRMDGSVGKSSITVEEDAIEVGWDWDESAVDSIEPLSSIAPNFERAHRSVVEDSPESVPPILHASVEIEDDEDWDGEIEIGDEKLNDVIAIDEGPTKSEPAVSTTPTIFSATAPRNAAPSADEEMIEEILIDPLATLQALEEWTRARPSTSTASSKSRHSPRSASPKLNTGDHEDANVVDDEDQGAIAAFAESDESPPSAPPPTSGPAPAPGPRMWVEGQHGFAPYSQLFARQRPSRG